MKENASYDLRFACGHRYMSFDYSLWGRGPPMVLLRVRVGLLDSVRRSCWLLVEQNEGRGRWVSIRRLVVDYDPASALYVGETIWGGP